MNPQNRQNLPEDPPNILFDREMARNFFFLGNAESRWRLLQAIFIYGFNWKEDPKMQLQGAELAFYLQAKGKMDFNRAVYRAKYFRSQKAGQAGKGTVRNAGNQNARANPQEQISPSEDLSTPELRSFSRILQGTASPEEIAEFQKNKESLLDGLDVKTPAPAPLNGEQKALEQEAESLCEKFALAWDVPAEAVSMEWQDLQRVRSEFPELQNESWGREILFACQKEGLGRKNAKEIDKAGESVPLADFLGGAVLHFRKTGRKPLR